MAPVEVAVLARGVVSLQCMASGNEPSSSDAIQMVSDMRHFDLRGMVSVVSLCWSTDDRLLVGPRTSPGQYLEGQA
jgi:hypothetical protein